MLIPPPSPAPTPNKTNETVFVEFLERLGGSLSGLSMKYHGSHSTLTQLETPSPVFSTLIGPDPGGPALFCHKEPAQGTQCEPGALHWFFMA